MIWIELIGPGGVGKSFIYQELCRKFPVFRPYYNITNNSFLSKLVPKSLRLGSYIHLRFVLKRMKVFKLDYDFRDEESISAFLNGLSVFTPSPIVKLELSKYFQYRYHEMKFYKSQLAKDGLFFSEDGIIHLSINGITSENLLKIRKPDVLIYLKASEAYVKKNRLARIQNNKPSLVERSVCREEFIQDFLPRNYALYCEKSEVLKEYYGKDFHELDVEVTPIHEIVERIHKICTAI